MTKVQYSFAQLGESEIFEPYLSSELKKNSDLWKPTEFELPLNGPGLAAAFLTLIQPDAFSMFLDSRAGHFRIKKRKLFSGSFSGLRDKGGTFGQLAAAGRKYSAFHQL